MNMRHLFNEFMGNENKHNTGKNLTENSKFLNKIRSYLSGVLGTSPPNVALASTV